jgi:hypothetical protein
MTMPERRAVYTALFGGYEDLGEQPIARETDIPFICFTDDPSLASETWQIELVQPQFPFDMVRSQRDVKLRGNAKTRSFDSTLYIDNSVRLSKTPDLILDEWLDGADYAACRHSYRERVVDEFDEIVALGYDDSSRVQEQLLHYAALYPEALYERPYWNAIIARRNTAQVQEMTTLWFDHVLRYSRRDQLSANVAMSLSSLKVRSIEQDNWLSDMHAWPVQVHRKVQLSKVSQRHTGPLLAEVARLELEVARLMLLLESHPAALLEIEDLKSQLEIERSRSIELSNALDRVFRSLSWRSSRPLRWAGAEFRRFKTGR